MKKVADIVIADITGEGTMGKYTGSRLYPTNDEIAQLAFDLYESRGRQDGHHVEDWLRAEQELMRHYPLVAKCANTCPIETASVKRRINV